MKKGSENFKRAMTKFGLTAKDFSGQVVDFRKELEENDKMKFLKYFEGLLDEETIEKIQKDGIPKTIILHPDLEKVKFIPFNLGIQFKICAALPEDKKILFTWEELLSETSNGLDITPDLNSKYNEPFYLTSGYRFIPPNIIEKY